MAAELRWILLGLSLLLLAGIWWWGARRSGQAPGNAELRESTAGRTAETPPTIDPYPAAAAADSQTGEHEAREWGVPPFEPLSIRTSEYDRVPVLDGPMMVHADPMEPDDFAPPAALETPSRPAAAAPAPAPTPAPAAALSPEASPATALNAAELQRIVTLRVSAAGETRWPGTQLMAALEMHGLSFGRYQVFHRKHVDGRSLFCVASLVEPGTFDIAGMAEDEFRGVTLFAVLPGPMEPVETIDELFATARGLAAELSGTVQDSKGMPLSQQRVAGMREDVARFQALLPGG